VGWGVDLCLVVPPFALVDKPALGPGILASACNARGLSVRTLYANLSLAARIGLEDYGWMASSPRHISLGERLFRPYAYSEAALADLDPLPPLGPGPLALEGRIAAPIATVLDETCERILTLRPRILGLSSTFAQTLACVAIAHRIKTAAPEICIVIGGPSVASPMGEALAEIFPWFDHFFLGEADVGFPEFCERLVRDGGTTAERILHCPPIMDLRASPIPEFEDYFETLGALQAEGMLRDLDVSLMFESSRGCWWGAKNHCTFCGLNGETMAFRAKPAEEALAEIDALRARWGIDRFMAADNILPNRYFDDFLPALAERDPPVSIFYETKANLSEAQLLLMARAGIDRIQPGIESLSSNVLKLMRKGVSAHHNIAVLRMARALGMNVTWNHLHGFPGETVADYAAIADILPALEHLEPPSAMIPIIIDRFSPYFNEPERMGIGELRPIRGYNGLYPREARLSDVAYHFKGSYTTPFMDDTATLGRLSLAFAAWQRRWTHATPPVLEIVEGGSDGVRIVDTRRAATAREHLLSPQAVAALRFFERAHVRESIDDALAAEVDALLAARLLIEHEGKLLSVVVRRPDP
jgi:ribosomal peptide maturation radical SAM protein 1